MANQKRIIFSPTEKNAKKIEKIKLKTGMSNSELINGLLDLLDSDKIKKSINTTDIRKNILKELL